RPGDEAPGRGGRGPARPSLPAGQRVGAAVLAEQVTMGRVRRFVRYLPALVLGRPYHGVQRCRPFFILGSGRCGTTLLRAMLEAHPDVHIPPENDLRAALRASRAYSPLPRNAGLRLASG